MTELEKINDACLIDSLAEIIRRLRRNELSALRCENALMLWEKENQQLKTSKKPKSVSDTPIDIEPPHTTREALRRVVNGVPMHCYQLLSEVKRKFPDVKTNLETCQVALRAMKRTEELEVTGTTIIKGVKGPPCSLYRKVVRAPMG